MQNGGYQAKFYEFGSRGIKFECTFFSQPFLESLQGIHVKYEEQILINIK